VVCVMNKGAALPAARECCQRGLSSGIRKAYACTPQAIESNPWEWVLPGDGSPFSFSHEPLCTPRASALL
jgi:hypothetical protein